MTSDLFHEKAAKPGQIVRNLATHFGLACPKLVDNSTNSLLFHFVLYLTKVSFYRLSMVENLKFIFKKFLRHFDVADNLAYFWDWNYWAYCTSLLMLGISWINLHLKVLWQFSSGPSLADDETLHRILAAFLQHEFLLAFFVSSFFHSKKGSKSRVSDKIWKFRSELQIWTGNMGTWKYGLLEKSLIHFVQISKRKTGGFRRSQFRRGQFYSKLLLWFSIHLLWPFQYL